MTADSCEICSETLSSKNREIYLKIRIPCENATCSVMVGHTKFVNKFSWKTINFKSKH